MHAVDAASLIEASTNETLWLIVGVLIAVGGVALAMWLHARKSKGMADKPKPK